MKLVCESCKTKYSIADEKVRGKVFKIKCKKCNHVIVVRGTSEQPVLREAGGQPAPEPQAAVDDQATRVFDYSGFDTSGAGAGAGGSAVTNVAAGGAQVWHVVIDGEQVGPLTEADLGARVKRGQIAADSFVWRDGFGDWQRLSAVGELANIVGARATDVARERPLFAAAPASAAAPLFSGAVELPPAGSSSSDNGSSAAPTPPQMTGTRNENSVLFSLKDLQSKSLGSKATAVRASSGPGTDSSGIVDIRALAAGVPRTEEDDLLPAFGQFAPSASPMLLAPTQSGYPKWVWPAAGGLGLLLLGVIAMMGYLLLRQPAAPVAVALAPSARAPAQAQASAGSPAPVPGATPLAAPAAAAAAPAAPAAPAKAAPGAVAESGRGSSSSRSSSSSSRSSSRGSRRGSRQNDDRDEPAPAAAAPTPAPKPAASPKKGSDELDDLLSGAVKPGSIPAPSRRGAPAAQASDNEDSGGGGSSLPAQLSRSQIQSGMAGTKSKCAACYEQYRVPGVVNVKITIGPNGRMSSSSVSGKFAGTPTGSCVEKAVKSARFDAFSGPPMQLDYPVILPVR